ncbi:MAG: hypothetical protein ABRQ38_06395 [Candidatus Eremiobacterota bacterium]
MKNLYGLRYHSGEIFLATPVKCWQMIAWAVQVCSSLQKDLFFENLKKITEPVIDRPCYF